MFYENNSTKRFMYVVDISKIVHYIISNFLVNNYIAIDATLGNGYDADFLLNNFNYVYSFDTQKDVC